MSRPENKQGITNIAPGNFLENTHEIAFGAIEIVALLKVGRGDNFITFFIIKIEDLFIKNGLTSLRRECKEVTVDNLLTPFGG